MRAILFKGKRVDNGEWIEGYLYRISEKINPFIMLVNKCGESHEVISETVGQFTGLTDKNANRIFEWDIIKTKYGRLCVVVWFASPQHNCWDLDVFDLGDNIRTRPPDKNDLYSSENLEIMGNIHDNPVMKVYS